MNWLRKAPSSVVIAVIVTAGVILLSVIVGFVYLTAIEADTTEFRAFANTLMNAVGLGLGAIGAVGGVAAASSSSKVEERTNGGLDRLVERKIEERNG